MMIHISINMIHLFEKKMQNRQTYENWVNVCWLMKLTPNQHLFAEIILPWRVPKKKAKQSKQAPTLKMVQPATQNATWTAYDCGDWHHGPDHNEHCQKWPSKECTQIYKKWTDNPIIVSDYQCPTCTIHLLLRKKSAQMQSRQNDGKQEWWDHPLFSFIFPYQSSIYFSGSLCLPL